MTLPKHWREKDTKKTPAAMGIPNIIEGKKKFCLFHA
jgi:hypothetical protein